MLDEKGMTYRKKQNVSNNQGQEQKHKSKDGYDRKKKGRNRKEENNNSFSSEIEAPSALQHTLQLNPNQSIVTFEKRETYNILIGNDTW